MIIYLLIDIIFNYFIEYRSILVYIYFSKRNYLVSFTIGLLYDAIFSSIPFINAISFLLLTFFYEITKNNKFTFIISLILYELTMAFFANSFNIFSIIGFTLFNMLVYIIKSCIILNRWY